MNIVTNRFETFLKQYSFVLLYSIVLRISYAFLCFVTYVFYCFYIIWNCLSIDNQYTLVLLTIIKANNVEGGWGGGGGFHPRLIRAKIKHTSFTPICWIKITLLSWELICSIQHSPNLKGELVVGLRPVTIYVRSSSFATVEKYSVTSAPSSARSSVT